MNNEYVSRSNANPSIVEEVKGIQGQSEVGTWFPENYVAPLLAGKDPSGHSRASKPSRYWNNAAGSRQNR